MYEVDPHPRPFQRGKLRFCARYGLKSPLGSRICARRLVGMPESYCGVYRRAMNGKSLRAAVEALCAECCGYDREAIRTCPATACPLWCVRPWQLKRTGEVAARLIREETV